MSKYNKNSFIKSPRIFDKKFLDLNTLPKIVQSNGDAVYTIEPDYDERPDVLADKLYGSSELWWVFALRNPDILVDPLEDFTSGKEIFIPSTSAIDRLR